jgi:hypothetical protein
LYYMDIIRTMSINLIIPQLHVLNVKVHTGMLKDKKNWKI